MEDILWTFGLGFFGMCLYGVIAVRKAIQKDRALKLGKFFGDNKRFWLVSLVLHAIVSVGVSLAPDMIDVLHALGFAVEDATSRGWILFGIGLAAGNDLTKASGGKTLSTKE